MMTIFRSLHLNTLSLLLLALNIFTYSCSDELSVKYSNLPIVILKADDLGDTTANWNRFMKIVADNEICAGIGIITKNITTKSSLEELKRISNLKQENNSPTIEFWNHGYDHSKEGNRTEFYGSDFEYQLSHIKKSQDYFTDSLAITCRTFSAPFNKSNSVTASALNQFPEIKIWMCYQKNEKVDDSKWKDPQRKTIDISDQNILLNVNYLYLHDFSFNNIKNRYNQDKKKPYILIQIHPALWDEESFDNFQKLITFYKDQKRAIFMTPYQYYQFLHEEEITAQDLL